MSCACAERLASGRNSSFASVPGVANPFARSIGICEYETPCVAPPSMSDSPQETVCRPAFTVTGTRPRSTRANANASSTSPHGPRYRWSV